MTLEVFAIQDEGQRIAVVDRRRKWVTVITLRKKKEVTVGQFEEMRPTVVDDIIKQSALSLFKKRGLI